MHIETFFDKQNRLYLLLIALGICVMVIGILHLLTSITKPNVVVFSYKEYIAHPSYPKIAEVTGNTGGYTDVIVGVENATSVNYPLVYKNFSLQTNGITYYPTLINTGLNTFIILPGQRTIMTLVFPINGLTTSTTLTIHGYATPIIVKQ